VRYAFDGHLPCIAQARRCAERFLASAPEAVDAGAVADARLAASELVTNAVQHARGPCVLKLSDDGRYVQIAVTDSSTRLPTERPLDFEYGTGGAGLLMLRQMADALEILPFPGGKTVRVTLDRARRPPGG
jgi:anti-sigma regulatory factor (Ser/Thr protein kinase)